MSQQVLDLSSEALSDAQAERRRSPRYNCHGSAEAMVLFPETLLRGEIQDISLFGCFLHTRAHLRLDRYCKVDLRFQVNGNHYRTVARVMGVRSGAGIGMEFFFDSPRDQVAFKNLVRSLSGNSNIH